MQVLVFLVLTLVFSGVLGAAGLMASSFVIRWRLKSASRAALAKLEADASAAGVALVRGRIAASGEGVGPAGGAGNILAIARTFSSKLGGSDGLLETSSVSEGLTLSVKSAPTPLEGKLELRGGSRWTWTSGKPYAGFEGTSTLEEGDEVVALVTAPSKSYREREETPPPELVGTIRVAAVAPPRISLAKGLLLRRPLPIVLALAGLVPAWMYAGHYVETRRTCATACEADGDCHLAFRPHAHASSVPKALATGDVFACEPESDADCAASRGCAELGWCSAKDGDCRALKDEDCRFTENCLVLGWCSAVDGRCALTKSEQCPTKGCLADGACSFDPARTTCVAMKDADCEQSLACRSDDRCHAKDGFCDRPEGGVPKRDCRKSLGCIESGECTTADYDGWSCVAKSDEDCLASQACLTNGRCKLEKSGCVTEHVHCSESTACRVYGACTDAESVGCAVRSDIECAHSSACKERGACKKVGDECAKDCSSTFDCRIYGLCAPSKDGCKTLTEAGCKASAACREFGSCTLADGLCRAETDADCAPTPGCKRRGQCSAKAGECVVAKAVDCKQSCTITGACTVKDGQCVAGADDDCRDSLVCKAEGRCVARDGRCANEHGGHCESSEVCTVLGACSDQFGGCGPKDDADCAASEVCKTRGWCFAVKDPSTYTDKRFCFRKAIPGDAR